jgi:hypothetical protein
MNDCRCFFHKQGLHRQPQPAQNEVKQAEQVFLSHLTAWQKKMPRAQARLHRSGCLSRAVCFFDGLAFSDEMPSLQ